MNFELSDDQRLLQDSVERLVRERADFTAWRARAADGDGFDRALWASMADLGWLSLTFPEALGGYGGSPVDTMVIMQGIGSGLMLEPYVGCGVIAPVLLPHLAADVAGPIAETVMSGAALVALADAEPGGRFDLAAVATRAERTVDGYRLTGEKSHVLDGAHADWFVIPARTGGASDARKGITLFLIPREAKGLKLEAFRAMDNRHNAALSLDGVAVAGSHVIGEVGKGFELLEEAVTRATAARLAEAVGAMEAAYEQTLQHVRTRRQFGQPIGGFQALQHRAVDMAIACEEARSMMYLATLALDDSSDERRRMVAAAKARVGQCGLYVCRQAVQLHGGIGFSDELPISHYLKRMAMIDLCYGNAAEQRRRLVSLDATGVSEGASL